MRPLEEEPPGTRSGAAVFKGGTYGENIAAIRRAASSILV